MDQTKQQLPGPPAHLPARQAGSQIPDTRYQLRGIDRSWAQTASPAPTSTEHIQLLDDAGARINELELLVSLVGEVERREAALKELTKPSDPPSLVETITWAYKQFLEFLDQPIQTRAGEEPQPLRGAVDQYRQRVETFRQNAIGPGGDTLQASRDRLTKFVSKLLDLDPAPEALIERAQTLLGDQALDPTALAAKLQQQRAAYAALETKRAELEAALETVQRTYGATIAKLTAQRATLRDALSTLADNAASSSELTTTARDGRKKLDALHLEQLDETMHAISDWVAKYRDDPTFLPAQVTARGKREFQALLGALEQQLAALEQQYNPDNLRAAEAERQRAQFTTLGTELGHHLTAIRERYQALVALRRQKLGSEPDERYFGSVAKSVNDAITALGDAENSLLALQSRVSRAAGDTPGVSIPKFTPGVKKAAHDMSYTGLRQEVLQVADAAKTLLTSTDEYADASQLEQTLNASLERELQPLTTLLAEARARTTAVQTLLRSFTGQPGLTPLLLGHIQETLKTLDEARRSAEQFSNETLDARRQTLGDNTLPSNVSRLSSELNINALKSHIAGQVRSLERALKATDDFADRAKFQAILSDEQERAELEAEAKRAEEAKRLERVRSELPSRLQAIVNRRDELRSELRAALGYVSSIEQYAPRRATELYQLLDDTLSVGQITNYQLPITNCGELLSSHEFWATLASDVADSSSDPGRIEASIGQIEVLLGSAGRLAAALEALQTERRAHPLATYRQWSDDLHSVRDKQRAIESLQALAEQSLVAERTAKQTLTGEEARRFVHQLDQDERQIDAIRARLIELTSVLGDRESDVILSGALAKSKDLEGVQRELSKLHADLEAIVQRHAQPPAPPAEDPSIAERHRLRTRLQAVLREPTMKTIDDKRKTSVHEPLASPVYRLPSSVPPPTNSTTTQKPAQAVPIRVRTE